MGFVSTVENDRIAPTYVSMYLMSNLGNLVIFFMNVLTNFEDEYHFMECDNPYHVI